MKFRLLFVAIALVAGVICARLGFWQLERRQERRAYNAGIAARSAAATVDVATLRGDTSELRYRRARITGVADYEHELVLGSRSRDGAPGVNLLTPVRIAGRDTAVLVNRGWTYSADAASPPDGSWREQDTVSYEGYVDVLAAGPPVPVNPRRPASLRRPVLATVRQRIPYPVAGIYLIALAPHDSARPGVPARLSLPSATDDGPHLGYALQWFIFATIAFTGAVIAFRKRLSPVPADMASRSQ